MIDDDEAEPLHEVGLPDWDEMVRRGEQHAAELRARRERLDEATNGRATRGAYLAEILMGTTWRAQGWPEAKELAELEPSHRRNLLSWLERHAAAIAQSATWWWCWVDPPRGEVAADDFYRAMDQDLELAHSNPLAWLDEQRLVKELRRLIREDQVKWRTAEARMARIEPDVFDAVG